MTPYNITETSLIKTGAGRLKGILINSHSSGTLKLVDGRFNGVAASGTLTSSGACAPAVYAESVVTASTVVEDDTLTIGSTVYTAKDTLTGAAYEVAIGAGDAEFLDNLKLAINATGTAGTNYGVGTEAHPTVIASTNTATTQKVVARVIGSAANSTATTSTGGTLTWADTTLGGGTGASVAGVDTTNATVTIGDFTYTATTSLAETHGLTAIPYQVLWVTSEAVFLDNLKSAINKLGTEGTDYATGTEQNGQVVATTNTDTTQLVVARKIGTAGNSIATTETLANYAWGAATLENGTGTTGTVIANTITFSAVATTGERYIPVDASFSTALLAVVGGTADLTLLVE